MKRISYIDLIRSFCIILMILGHLWLGNTFNHFIHAFHMPIFFIISGYFYKEIPFKDFLIKKAKSLIIPYFVFGIIIYIIWYILYSSQESEYIYINLINILYKNTEHLAIAGALWFLSSLFFSEIIFYFINKINANYIKYILTILISLLGCTLDSIFDITLPFGINASLVGVGLMEIGLLLSKNKTNRLLNLNIFYSLLLSIITIFLIFINKTINMRTNNYDYILLFWIISFLSFIVLINISKTIDLKIPIKIKNELLYIGQNSITYLIFNQLFIVLFYDFFQSIFVFQTAVTKLIVKVLIFILTMLVIRIISVLLNNTKLKILLGKY